MKRAAGAALIAILLVVGVDIERRSGRMAQRGTVGGAECGASLPLFCM